MHRPILLQFHALVHYGSAEPAVAIKARTTGGTGNLKWQCSPNRHQR